MASSLTKQQMKLSKSMISFSAYRATRIWFSLLFSLKPTNDQNNKETLFSSRSAHGYTNYMQKYRTCCLHGKTHLVWAHGSWFVQIKLSENDLKDRNNSVKTDPELREQLCVMFRHLTENIFLPASSGSCSIGSETPRAPDVHFRLSGEQRCQGMNHREFSCFVWEKKCLYFFTKQDTSIRLTMVLHDSILKPSVFRSLSKKKNPKRKKKHSFQLRLQPSTARKQIGLHCTVKFSTTMVDVMLMC